MSDSITTINSLLADHLFQVIGSTPKSIADNLKKLDLKDKTDEGSRLVAVAVFSAAVNKSTMENYLAKPEFTSIRQLVLTAMSIQGRSNMTAFTLLGHCLLTTSIVDDVIFVSEFRKKMGQKHLWENSLDNGQLSDKQKGILKEKKRVTNETDARLLGSGFLKWTGIDSKAMTSAEAEFWGIATARTTTPPRRGNIQAPVGYTSPRARGTTFATSSSAQPTGNVTVPVTRESTADIPEDVFNYRKNVLNQTDSDISASLNNHGFQEFVSRTREMMRIDPDGSKTTSASTVGRR